MIDPLVIEMNHHQSSAQFVANPNGRKLTIQQTISEQGEKYGTVMSFTLKDASRIYDYLGAWLKQEQSFSPINAIKEVEHILRMGGDSSGK